MTCANHPGRERTAFCQNCGKPICSECVRTLGTSIFCEPCFLARTAPGAATGPAADPNAYAWVRSQYARPPAGEPSPGLAALLGFIPGVGAMYNEQYGKGIVHLIVFAILVSLSHESGIFGLFVAGWIAYMVIEAHHTASARRDGTPLPNPFGLNDIAERFGFGKAWPNPAPGSETTPNPSPMPGTASGPDPGTAGPPPYSAYTNVPPAVPWGAPQDAFNNYAVPPVPPVPPMPPFSSYPDPPVAPYTRRFPEGAVWLIGLGVLFLFGNLGILNIFHTRLFGPLLLIGIGVWLFVHRMTRTGGGLENDGSPDYHLRLGYAIRNSVWVVLTGVLWLLASLHILSWSRSWPLYLIGAGLLAIFRGPAYGGYGPGISYPAAYPPAASAPVTTASLVPTHDLSTSDAPPADREGR